MTIPVKSCPSRALLIELHLGQLPDAAITEWADHLDSCAQCQEALDRLRQQAPDALYKELSSSDVVTDPAILPGRVPSSDTLRVVDAPVEKPAAATAAEGEELGESGRGGTGVTIDAMVKQLEESGLVPSDKLSGCVPPNAAPKDAEEFIGALVRAGHLTRFQAQQAALGKAKALMLGSYTILDKIGAGGMGQVFKAQHRRMDRIVAIKMLPPTMTTNPAAVARFEREVRAAARLEHPNIVTAYDADQANGAHFLVMQFVDGKDLSALVKKDGPFSVRKSVHCILQAGRGLEFAHKKGVIHRDIKPANLLLDIENTVKILDMGLARIDAGEGVAAQAELTGTDTVMGTVDYMAPEQGLSTKHADAQADIYSLGCTLHYLLVGKPVYSGETVAAKLVAHHNHPIPDLCQLREDVPEMVAAVFRKMVGKRTEDRYQTMTEVIAALERCQAAAPSASASFVSTKTTQDEMSGLSLALAHSPLRSIDDNQPRHIEPESVPREAKTGGKQPPGKHNKLLIGAAGAAGLVALLLGVIVIVRNKDGKEVAKLEVPDGHSVEVQPTPANTTPAKSTPTPPSTAVASSVPAIGSPPAPAKAPFDAAQAKAHQEAWAKYFGTKVESTNSVGQTMVLIPPGEFLMGSTDEQVAAALKVVAEIKDDQGLKDRIPKAERPQHQVIISKPFLMGATEVTVRQFKQFVEATKFVTEAEQYGFGDSEGKVMDETTFEAQKQHNWRTPGYALTDESPVAQVTWNDACAFCNWLSKQEQRSPCYRPDDSGTWFATAKGNGYRLPTEAEWEYACRAGTTTQYSFGDDYANLKEYAWYNENSDRRARSVGLKLDNPFGLYDVHGNLCEWCQDFSADKWYEKSLPNDPNGPVSGFNRVMRGGSWHYSASYGRSAYRHPVGPSGRFYYLGFRIVRVLDGSTSLTASVPTTTASGSTPSPYEILTSPDWEWTEPENLGPGVNGASADVSPTLSGDGLTLVFGSFSDFDGQKGGLKIATRDSVSELFGKAVKIGGPINTEFSESFPAISPDGLALVFSSDRPGGEGGEDIWQAVRQSTREPFSEPKPLGKPVNSPGREVPLIVGVNGLSLVFERAGKIWATRRTSREDPFSGAVPFEFQRPPQMGSIYGTTLSSDQRVLIYGCPPRKETPSKSNLAMATRSTPGTAFSVPVELGPNLNSETRDTYPALSADGTTLIFISDRPGGPEGPGDYDLWMSRRVRKATTSTIPAPAKAPFDAAQAKAHQEGWAKHLGTTVETTNSVGQKMILIPPGEFLMGSTDEQVAAALKVVAEINGDQALKVRIPAAEPPQHRIIISKPFLMGATEVTVGQFKQFVEATKFVTEAEQYGFGDSGGKVVDEKTFEAQKQHNWRTPGYVVTDESPVAQVTWNDACAFCNWLSEQDQRSPCYRPDGSGSWFFTAKGNGYRLPTEAEWEYACRAGTTTQYSFGDDYKDLKEYAWYNENSGRRGACLVGLKLDNPFGLYDVHGNLCEWCHDFYDDAWYEKSPLKDPNGPVSGINHVMRGGGWYFRASYARSAYRHPVGSSVRQYYLGFRIVRVLDGSTSLTPGAPTASVTPQPSAPVAVPRQLFINHPAFQQWMKDVQALPAEQQVEAVRRKLVELNPGFDGKVVGVDRNATPRIENGVVTVLGFFTDNVTDISPVRALGKLNALYCPGSAAGKGILADLSPLQGMLLGDLDCGRSFVSDLSPLKGMPLTRLNCAASLTSDLSPLHGMPLTRLYCSETQLSDLSPLKGMQLTHLMCPKTQVIDLSALRGMPLTTLNIAQTKVSELSSLKGMPLDYLQCAASQVSDLSPLETCKSLTSLYVQSTKVTAASVAALQKALPNCQIEWDDPSKSINKTTTNVDRDRRAAEWALSKGGTVDVIVGAKETKDIADVANLPAEQFVLRKIQSPLSQTMNDDDAAHFKGLASLETLVLGNQKITDVGLESLRDMPRLTWLNLQGTNVTNDGLPVLGSLPSLSVLNIAGVKITGDGFAQFKKIPKLKILALGNSLISDRDLPHLYGMQSLTQLGISGSKVTPAGIAALQKALPNCKIEWDDQVKPTAPQPAAPVGSTPAKPLTNINDPAFQAWVKSVAAMPAEKQIEAVAKKLVELNPGFDGKVTDYEVKSTPTIEKGVVTEFRFLTDEVTDISPVRGLVGLRRLSCIGSSNRKGKLSELSSLQGMPLTTLNVTFTNVSDLSPLKEMPLRSLYCGVTPISDLAPLQGMPLVNLSCYVTKISDLSPLKGMPLKVLACNTTQVSNLTPLEVCKSLTELNIANTKVTPAQVAALQKVLPNCKIEWDDPTKPKTPEPASSGTK